MLGPVSWHTCCVPKGAHGICISAHHFTSVKLGCVSVCAHAAVQNGEWQSAPSGALHAATGGKGDNSAGAGQVNHTITSLHKATVFD